MTNKPSNSATVNFPFLNNQNYLADKVVLLIGNDMTMLQTITLKIAQNGADVALICQKIPWESLREVKENVERTGRRLLVIEDSDRRPVSAEWLIQTVISQLGRLDIFIDLTRQKRMFSFSVDERKQVKEWFPSSWSLMQAVLEEIATT